MFRHILRQASVVPKRTRSLCSGCYRQQRTTVFSRFQRKELHTSRPVQVPIVPIPAMILTALKTGKLVSLVSLSSKTSLTLLPHTFRRGSKGDLIAKILAGIPLFGFTLLLVIGLDQVKTNSGEGVIFLCLNSLFSGTKHISVKIDLSK